MTEKRFTKQEVYDGINRYRINDSNFIVEILDDGIPMHYSTIVNRLNEQHKTITRLEKENEQLKSYTGEMEDYLARLEEKNGQLKKQLSDDFNQSKYITVQKSIICDLKKENEQLKQRCKELRNDLIDHSALINMLEKVKALNIEDMIWNTMGYKTQTEFDDDFADYREYAKKRWRE